MKKSENPFLKTKRLVIRPVTDAELDKLIADTDDEGLKAVYMEMQSAARADEANRTWYVPWVSELKKEKTAVGYLGFHGPVQDDAVEIGYGTNTGFEGNGYAGEAADALVAWALNNDKVFFVEAEAEKENLASRRILEKLNFTEYGHGEEGIRYVKERQATGWTAVYMCFGVSIGYSLGNALYGSASIGMAVGIALGCAIGASLDKKAKDAMSAARERRKSRLS